MAFFADGLKLETKELLTTGVGLFQGRRLATEGRAFSLILEISERRPKNCIDRHQTLNNNSDLVLNLTFTFIVLHGALLSCLFLAGAYMILVSSPWPISPLGLALGHRSLPVHRAVCHRNRSFIVIIECSL